jgi:hypothetical protein
MFADSDEFFFIAFLNRQAGRAIYKKFRVNSKELELLAGLSTYLVLSDKKACALTSYSSFNHSGVGLIKKQNGYLKGLINKGLLHVVGYKMQPGRYNSVALTSYGSKVLEAFYSEAEKIRAKHKDRFTKLGFKDIGFHASEVESALPWYTLHSAGRDE